MFAKISVAGKDQSPLYAWLTRQPDKSIAGRVVWNFQKYLVGRDGRVLAKFGPRTKPHDAKLVKQLEAALAVPAPKRTGDTTTRHPTDRDGR